MDAALSAAISGLKANSTALGTISNNLANSQTTGYKAVTTQFLSQLTSSSSATYYPAGGVRAVANQNLSDQGISISTATTTHVAIDGEGLFALQYGLISPNNTYANVSYTRNGTFEPDNDGNLNLHGTNYYLMGWPVNSQGEIVSKTDPTISNPSNADTTASLTVVNVNKFNSSAVASSNFTMAANLPAQADIGDSFFSTMEVYDSLGVAQYFKTEWIKTGANAWNMNVYNPTSPDGTTVTGTITGAAAGATGGVSYAVTFNPDASLAGIAPDATPTAPLVTGVLAGPPAAANTPLIEMANWTNGAATGAGNGVQMNLGTAGMKDGMTQYSSTQTIPDIEIKSKATDGVQYGSLVGVSIDSKGYVVAHYSNNLQTAIYKIPVVTFNNADGLSMRSNGVYDQTSESGKYILNHSGTNRAGTTLGQALENSNVDTSHEFSNMIVCQQAYSAASQIIGTDKEMFQTLIQQL